MKDTGETFSGFFNSGMVYEINYLMFILGTALFVVGYYIIWKKCLLVDWNAFSGHNPFWKVAYIIIALVSAAVIYVEEVLGIFLVSGFDYDIRPEWTTWGFVVFPVYIVLVMILDLSMSVKMKDYWREMFSYPQLYVKLAKVKKIIEPDRVNYGSDKHQFFLHFKPQGTAKKRVIVWIHGGGWNAGSPDDFRYVGQSFAQEGYHCVSLGYRLSPKNKYPVQIEDVCAGYGKAMEYLAGQGIDCSHVIVTGPSAGAHLSSILCYGKKYQEKCNVDISKIVGFIGVAGPYVFGKNISNTVKILLWQLFSKDYDRTDGEPVTLFAANHIPMLLIHSKHDGLIDFSQSEALYEKAKETGVQCELYEVVDKINTHSAYSAGMFLETRETNQALDKLFTWIEAL
ncbi:MAG: alpha/beta hydrolase [Lachnospiraceae bacterium]|nr:alpha/beta hydrolase [Lachnospiraceae bacterium]